MGPTPIRGRRLRVVREEFAWLRSRLPTLWTNSYFVAHRWRFRLELTEEQERLDIPGRLSSVGEVNSPLLARGVTSAR